MKEVYLSGLFWGVLNFGVGYAIYGDVRWACGQAVVMACFSFALSAWWDAQRKEAP